MANNTGTKNPNQGRGQGQDNANTDANVNQDQGRVKQGEQPAPVRGDRTDRPDETKAKDQP